MHSRNLLTEAADFTPKQKQAVKKANAALAKAQKLGKTLQRKYSREHRGFAYSIADFLELPPIDDFDEYIELYLKDTSKFIAEFAHAAGSALQNSGLGDKDVEKFMDVAGDAIDLYRAAARSFK